MAHVYKTTPVGNGDLYGWKEVDENGEVVRVSEQHYHTEADAEKAIRTIAPSKDIIEVEGIKNVNTDANQSVNLVDSGDRIKDRFHGMNPVPHSVDEIHPNLESLSEKVEETHPNLEKMEEGTAYDLVDEAIEEAKVEAKKLEEDRKEEESKEEDLESLTKEELLAIVDSESVKGVTSNSTKADIVAAIEEARG